MRKPRSKLEVSTFPFLAVLLCIMGSLMLLLFIMDRRAKIAARHHNEEELQVRQKRTKDEEDARQAEWEKARQQLHASLMQQVDQLAAQSTSLQQNVNDAGCKLALIQAGHTGLAEKIKNESAAIGVLHLAIEGQRAGLKQADKMDLLSKAELLAAAKELAELERALQQLRLLKNRDKNVYSLVPYRGKRGDQRPPIYVECIGDGVVFHPDTKSVRGWDFSPGAVRGEVERRCGPLAVQKSAPGKDDAKGPYVLFIVRPAGIASYYKAQAALKGLNVAFGYELVDADWSLDFGGDAFAKGGLPGRTQVPWKADDEIKPKDLGPPLFAPQPGGVASGAPGSGVGSGSVLPPPAGSGFGSALPSPPSGGSGFGSALPAPPSTGSGLGSALPAPPPGGSSLGSALPAPPQPNGNPPSGGGAPKPPAFVPIGTGTPTGTPAGNGGGGQPGKSSAQPGGSPEESPGKSPPAFSVGQTKKPTPASPLSKLLGNKDFVITLDCRGDDVTITPSGLLYRWTAANASETDAALVKTVTNLIARRQASVRPGEPPYRPQICFRVEPDGLRMYLRVYPLLERLGVPMTRENVVE